MESVMEHPERWAAALGGAALVVLGAKKLASERHPLGALLATTGAGLILRSTRSDATRERLSGARGVVVEESAAINRSPADLYEFWRTLDLLPMVMPELRSVEQVGHRRSHWIANGPARLKVEWYADIINDIPNEMIAWRTIDGSQVACAGSIHFDQGLPGRGTVVHVKLQYDPPAGKVGSAVAWLLGHEPSQVIREGLRRFKQLMETGEIPTTAGQSRGKR